MENISGVVIGLVMSKHYKNFFGIIFQHGESISGVREALATIIICNESVDFMVIKKNSLT